MACGAQPFATRYRRLSHSNSQGDTKLCDKTFHHMQSFLHPCPHYSNTIFRCLLPHFVCGEMCTEHWGIVGVCTISPGVQEVHITSRTFLYIVGVAVSISSSSNVMRSMCTSLGVHRTKSQNNRLVTKICIWH